MITYSLTEHRYSDKPRRLYVDGVRVPAWRFDIMMQRAHSFGQVFNMQTRAHPYGEGCTHRINTQTITLNKEGE